jgi:hypothetical protein
MALVQAADVRPTAAVSDQPAGKAQGTGSVEQKVHGLMTVWSEAKFNFPYFDRIQDVDWDKKAQEYVPRVFAAETPEAYYDILMEFAALLKDGHTAVIPPWGYVRPGHDHPPVELQLVGDFQGAFDRLDRDKVRKFILDVRYIPGEATARTPTRS